MVLPVTEAARQRMAPSLRPGNICYFGLAHDASVSYRVGGRTRVEDDMTIGPFDYLL